MNDFKMKISISKGNIKLGKIANISLSPIKSCGKLPCNKDCYSIKAYRIYPIARKAWDNNLKTYTEKPDFFFDEVDKFFSDGKTRFFRWQQAGDIPDQSYLDGMVKIAKKYPDIKYLAFTKKYYLDYSDIPYNLQIIFSAWPGHKIPLDIMPIAFMQDGTEDRVVNTIECPGNCENCGLCWSLGKLNKNVVFYKH